MSTDHENDADGAGGPQRVLATSHPPLEPASRGGAPGVHLPAEDKYRLLFQTNRDGIAYVAMDGHILDANPAYQEMLGYGLEELQQLTYQQLTPAKWHAFEDEVIVPQIVGRGYSDEYEKEYVRKDGSVLPVSIKSWRMHDAHGTVLMCGVVRDITDRKRAQSLLEQSRRRLALHLERTPLPVIEWDPAGRVLFWNAAAERTFGYSTEHALGCHVAALLFSDDAFARVTAASTGGDRGQPAVLENRTGDGRRITCEWFVSELIDSDGKAIGTAALARDVSERLRSDRALMELERKLQETQKLESLGMLAGGVAHDFNNLLTGILGNASLAELELSPASPARAYLASIQAVSAQPICANRCSPTPVKGGSSSSA